MTPSQKKRGTASIKDGGDSDSIQESGSSKPPGNFKNETDSRPVQATKKPQKRRRRERRPYHRTKKPLDMPKRPLSAYNFFFQRQRELILAERDRKETTEGGVTFDEPGSSITLFESMGKTIAARWKALSSDEHAEYVKMAADDTERHHREMEDYNAKQAKNMHQVKAQEVASQGEAKYAQESQSLPSVFELPSVPSGVSSLFASALGGIQQHAHLETQQQLMRLAFGHHSATPSIMDVLQREQQHETQPQLRSLLSTDASQLATTAVTSSSHSTATTNSLSSQQPERLDSRVLSSYAGLLGAPAHITLQNAFLQRSQEEQRVLALLRLATTTSSSPPVGLTPSMQQGGTMQPVAPLQPSELPQPVSVPQLRGISEAGGLEALVLALFGPQGASSLQPSMAGLMQSSAGGTSAPPSALHQQPLILEDLLAQIQRNNESQQRGP